MSPPLGPPIAAAWLFLGHASFWYMLEHRSIDLYDFFGKGNWPAGAVIVTLLGPLTLPTYYIIKWRRRR